MIKIDEYQTKVNVQDSKLKSRDRYKKEESVQSSRSYPKNVSSMKSLNGARIACQKEMKNILKKLSEIS